jgi:hypothetical protein
MGIGGTGMPSNRTPESFLDLGLHISAPPITDSLDNRDSTFLGRRSL